MRARVELAAGTGRLDLSHLGLRELPPEVFDLGPALTDLAASDNLLEHLPEDLGRLSGLRRLALAGNRLAALPRAFGRLEGLEGAWLHGNCLSELPPDLGGLGSLRDCSFAGNQLRSVPGALLGGLPALERLSLAGNRLTALPSAPRVPLRADLGGSGGCSLRELMLNGNALEELPPDLFARLPRLESLHLQGNRLGALPPGAGGLRALRDLCVADNRLRALPAGLADLPGLRLLTAYGNELGSLPPGLGASPELQGLWLEGNPVAADDLERLLGEVEARGGAAAAAAARCGWAWTIATCAGCTRQPRRPAEAPPLPWPSAWGHSRPRGGWTSAASPLTPPAAGARVSGSSHRAPHAAWRAGPRSSSAHGRAAPRTPGPSLWLWLSAAPQACPTGPASWADSGPLVVAVGPARCPRKRLRGWRSSTW